MVCWRYTYFVVSLRIAILETASLFMFSWNVSITEKSEYWTSNETLTRNRDVRLHTLVLGCINSLYYYSRKGVPYTNLSITTIDFLISLIYRVVILSFP